MANPAKDARDEVQANWPGASVHSRGSNWIKHEHPSEADRFVLDAHITPIHYGANLEIDTAWEASTLAPWLWQMVSAGFNVYVGPGTTDFDAGQIVRYVHPASGEDVTFEPQQLQWTNDLDQIEAVADPQTISHSSIDDDTINWQGAYGAGLDFRWEAQTARLAKFLTIQSLAAIGSPAQFIIDGGNPVLRVPFIFQKSANIDIYIDGVLWNEAGNNPQTTSGDVEFRFAATGAPLWWFKSPTVKHSPKDAPPLVQQRFRKQATSLFVEVLIPWAWLETASYPVEIDPTIDEQVGASSDDASEGSGGSMDLTSTAINIWSSVPYAGFRFTSVALAGTETINDDTYINLLTSSFLDAECDIYAEDVDDAGTFTSTGSDISNRTGTTASVVWSATANLNNWTNSPGIKTVIQEIIDRGGWGTGQDIAIILNVNATCDLSFFTYDSGAGDAPKLHIDYTAGGAGDLSPSVSDAITVGESVTVAHADAMAIIASESATIGESITMALGDLVVSVAESVTVGETVNLELISDISVTESVTVGESSDATISTLVISVSESVTVGEVTTADVIRALSVSESVTVGESVTAVLPDALQIAISEAVTIGESNDATISDLVVSVAESVTVGESVALSLGVAGAYEIAVSESVTVGESVTAVISDMSVAVTDTVTVGESSNVSLIAIGTLTVSVSETVTVGEAVTITPLLLPGIAVTDGVTVGESVTVSPPTATTLSVLVSEAFTVGELVTITPLLLAGINVTDALTVGESTSLVFELFGLVDSFGTITSPGAVGVVRSPYVSSEIESPSAVGKVKSDRYGN